ncbi:UNVERIFIED_CONTAM: hypothetical protein GTU68_028550 [Idotea baltica]|nr:hypothetical protein [Idotea baltica]
MHSEHLQDPDSYNVFPLGIESPNHGTRSLETDPANATASPHGWHDTDGESGAEYTTTQGNNVHAYEDRNNTNQPGFSPDGGAGLDFDFPLDHTQSLVMSESAVITNLFYWNNLMHDIWYHYGFDEASGNFQANNYENGGLAGDYVLAEAQDGSGTGNANFSTPPDGSLPRMQMYFWQLPAEIEADSDLDNGVIAHEYGHGISNRLTGGPGTTGCLSNQEQMGEGWSDWFGLMLTMDPGAMGTDTRGIGTYLLGQTTTGDGIRPHPYSTDMVINPHTYNDIKTEAIPHGVGSVWCEMLWEMTWLLIDEYGFDEDLYLGTGGNNIAMHLVVEGLKLQVCSPGFVDGRDAILAADQLLYGGANHCLIWKAFAKRGLGYSANQGSSNSRSDGMEAFDLPPGCIITVTKTVNTLVAEVGDTLMYSISLHNVSDASVTNVVVADDLPENTTYVEGSASDGGSLVGESVEFPATTLTVDQQHTFNFKVAIDPETDVSLYATVEDAESASNDWLTNATNNGLSSWEITSAAPYDGDGVWFAPDVASPNDQYLVIAEPLIPSAFSQLKFWHSYNTESAWDGGLVEVSLDNQTSWHDLGDFFTQNEYNSTINLNSSTPAFSGNSGGYIQSVIDLSSFVDQNIYIRFWMHCDLSVGGDGWSVDNIELTNLRARIPNTAIVSADGIADIYAALQQSTKVNGNCEDALVFSNPFVSASEEHRANFQIQLSSAISGNSEVYFRAADNVQFESGFEVQLGSFLRADIGECDDPPLLESMEISSSAKAAETPILGQHR